MTVVVDPTHAVTGADESKTTFSFSFSPQAPTSLPGKFINPLGTQQSDWTIVNYVDVNPLPVSYADFDGGPFTYDGHSGIDMTLANFAHMDAGYPVYAALGGTVIAVQDGNFDRDTAFSTNPANYVEIDDGNGWETIYYHFMANSIAVKVGETVTSGQVLGLVGSSGDSTDPHLHFEVHHNGDVVETNYDPSDYWVSPMPYEGNVPAYVLGAGITNSNPVNDEKEGPVSVPVFPTSSNAPASGTGTASPT